jgi:hypothetical protein
MGSILFLKNDSKKNAEKNYKNHLRSDNYEVCTAVARCFPNILDVMIIEIIYKCLEIKCGDRHEGLMNLSSIGYRLCQQCTFQPCTLISYVGLHRLSCEKITCSVIYLVIMNLIQCISIY